MARNEEKANAALNRWVSMKTTERLGFHDKRPLRTTAVTTVAEAEKWRSELVREIIEKAAQIQNGLYSCEWYTQQRKGSALTQVGGREQRFWASSASATSTTPSTRSSKRSAGGSDESSS